MKQVLVVRAAKGAGLNVRHEMEQTFSSLFLDYLQHYFAHL
jgi:hypothetical protein